jgi:hypothetical protein
LVRKPSPENRRRKQRELTRLPFSRRREVRIIAGLVLVFGLFALPIFLFPVDPPAKVSPERSVTIYSLHRCPCAFSWKRALEQQGFSVAVFKLESVKSLRMELRTPVTGRSCHVGKYLDYTLEGHVPADSLAKLSELHPAAIGLMIVTKSSQAIHGSDPNNDGVVVIVDKVGEASPWSAAAVPTPTAKQ